MVQDAKMRFIKPVEAADAAGDVCEYVCKKKVNEYAEKFRSFSDMIRLPKHTNKKAF
jgi:hypothetical protein